MRVAFLGMDGPLSTRALDTLAERAEVAFVGTPSRLPAWPGREALRRLRRALGRGAPSLESIARRAGVTVTPIHGRDDDSWHEPMAAARPDLLCVAGFPWILPQRVLRIPPGGALNVHPSLLPRHRGPLPLFWIYHADDRKSGVTVHWMEADADAGPVAAQQSFPLPRGLPVDDLNLRNADLGAALLDQALSGLADGSIPSVPQDHALATSAPFVREAEVVIPFDAWPAERVWHFLHGLFPRFRATLQDERGAPVDYRGVGGYERSAHGRRPGTAERSAGGYALHCLDGTVELRS